MSATPLQRPATYQDVLDAPEHMVAQVLGGELYLQARPATRHARSGSSMGAFIWSRFEGGDGPGGWVIVFEPELHLGSDIVVPDVAGWREERYPEPVAGEDPPYFTVAPDWVAEILSPGTARVDRMKKVPIYAREAVAHVWLVDPRDKTVEVLRLEGAGYRLVGTFGGDDEEFSLEPFDAVRIPARAVWGRTIARP